MVSYYKTPQESIVMRNHHYILQYRDIPSLNIVTLNYMNDCSVRSGEYLYDLKSFCARRLTDKVWVEIKLTDQEWFDIILPKINEKLKEYNIW